MNWLIYSILCVIGWGGADIFYKQSSDPDDRYSHVKISVWVGLVMGAVSFAMLFLFGGSLCESGFLTPLVKYSPAALSYIISMIIGYAGLRYLELSVISPVQNASGALSSLCIISVFLITGRVSKISDVLSSLDIVGTVFIVCGVLLLAVAERRVSLADRENGNRDKKYRFGAAALVFPLLYCVFDTVGTAADGLILDEKSGMGLGEIDVLILYGITFFTFGVLCWLFLLIKTKNPYNPFGRGEAPKCIAAFCEESGQIFYVFAMAANPVLAAPTVASYCIISVILSRIILKEKLSILQNISIASVIVGIVILGISEGMG